MQASALGVLQSTTRIVSRIVKDLLGAEVPADQVQLPLLLHLGSAPQGSYICDYFHQQYIIKHSLVSNCHIQQECLGEAIYPPSTSI